MQSIRFNTGRLYTSVGQLIYARIENGLVKFIDHSRMISGEFPAEEFLSVENPGHFVRVLMSHYDRSQYTQNNDVVYHSAGPANEYRLIKV